MDRCAICEGKLTEVEKMVKLGKENPELRKIYVCSSCGEEYIESDLGEIDIKINFPKNH